jgi:hypothetical protein
VSDSDYQGELGEWALHAVVGSWLGFNKCPGRPLCVCRDCEGEGDQKIVALGNSLDISRVAVSHVQE